MDVWNCCHCGNSNLKHNAPDRCPICPHYRCGKCTWGLPPSKSSRHRAAGTSRTPSSQTSSARKYLAPQPRRAPSSLPPPLSSGSYSFSQNTSFVPADTSHLFNSRPLPSHGSGYGPSHATPPSSYTYSSPPSRSSYQQAGYPTSAQSFSRPSMEGWWRCCRNPHQHLNNPALSSGRCTQCNHTKCSSCRPA